MGTVVIRYKHEPISPDCKSSRRFTLEVPELQDGFFDVPRLLCPTCKVEPMIVSDVLAPSAARENEESAKQARQPNDPHKDRTDPNIICPWCKSQSVEPQAEEWLCLTCHGNFSAGEGISAARLLEAVYRDGDSQSKIEEFRDVRERLMWDGDTTVVPTQDGTPLSRKMFVETLCVAQARIGNSPYDEERKLEHIARLQVLIDIFEDRG